MLLIKVCKSIHGYILHDSCVFDGRHRNKVGISSKFFTYNNTSIFFINIHTYCGDDTK